MKTTDSSQIVYDKLHLPQIGTPAAKPVIPAERYRERLRALREKMKKNALDAVAVYADREHFWNFKYFMGFDPRFEEALLVVTAEDPSWVLLGNECLGLAALAPVPVKSALCQQFSLPNQPMNRHVPLTELLASAGIAPGAKVGLIGWKMFTDERGQVDEDLFCVPHFIVEAARRTVGASGALINAAHLLIRPEDGLRVVHDADSVAFYEYGAAYASEAVRTMLTCLKPGMTEGELCNLFVTNGQPLNLHPFALAAHNADKGLICASDYAIRLGDGLNLCFSLEGGLTCRHAYVAQSGQDLPEETRDYIEKLVKPYYAAVVTWYENLRIGQDAGAVYRQIEAMFPKARYGWVLNTGHLSANEEWQSSPFYAQSSCAIRSGMLFQMDIIPDVAGYHGPNAEDGVLVADESLRKEIAKKHPDVYDRMQKRRAYMIEQIGIDLPEEVLPMSNLAAYFAPYMMNREMGMRVKKS